MRHDVIDPWALSRYEAQLTAQQEALAAAGAYEGAPPVHRDLQRLGFMPFPDEIAGKEMAFRGPELLDDDIKAMFRVLTPYWEGVAARE